ncbi:unnamed protein product [Paramecium sonneborni]|uniref:BPL/LPL catalytic domain-containing protein n=1 Tax=Paramecium sonneborni TaxID=65129 RepID=A0A8S1QQ05_9CILI|nr:unnamed protein product [Paramecium sonneborni]
MRCKLYGIYFFFKSKFQVKDIHKIVDIQFEEIDSTQTHAKLEYENKYKGQITFLRAVHQIAGKGQYDRKWECQSKRNILTTIIFPYFTNIQYQKNVTLVIGYTIVQIYKELYNVDAELKWVNDILLNSKKSGGILTESEQIGDQLVLYIGIGLNIDWCIEDATCLEQILGKKIDQEELFLKVKERVIQTLYTLNEQGFEIFRIGINQVLYRKGQFCEFVNSKTLQIIQTGIVEELNKDGDLVIRGQDGIIRIIEPNLRMKL